VREPTFSERFDSQGSGGNINPDPVVAACRYLTGKDVCAYTVTPVTTGNPNLKPEQADTVTFGAIYRPRWVEGLQMSVDYYDITVSNVIDSLSAEQTTNFCLLNGVQRYCNNMKYLNGVLSTIDLYYENLNKLKAKGLDVEASYRLNMADIASWGAGELQLRALGTHYIENITDNNVTAYNLAGANAGNTPDWRYRLSALYKLDSWTMNLTMRGVRNGIISEKFVECASSCVGVTDTKNYFSINDNHVAGAVYLDASITKSFEFTTGKGDVFFAANNLLNRDPPLVVNPDNAAAENTPAYLQTNRNLFDVMGRVYRLGVRYSF
jgi:iron complex outermembrane receptor protein